MFDDSLVILVARFTHKVPYIQCVLPLGWASSINSHKSYNKKEVRMATRGGGGHNTKKTCISHQIDE